MARTRSLAGQAASAARKVIPRRGQAADAVAQADTVEPNGEKTPSAAKRSPAASTSKKSATTKKSTGKKSAATKTPAKTTTAKKSTAKKSTAKESAGKKSTTQTSTVKKAPAKKSTAAKKTTPAEETAATKKSTAAKKSTTAKKTTAEKTTTKRTPAKSPAKKSPAKKTAKKTPAKKTTPVNKSSTKKSSATKAAAADLVVREDEHAWTPEELAEVLGELNEQRTHSLEVIGQHQTELDGLMREPGDGAGHDQADVGSSAFERDHELQVLGNERDKLTQIDRALARIEDGSYGQCERCGNPIGKMRLMAFPRATLCMTCKQREERR